MFNLLDIYFHQGNAEEHEAAVRLRDAVLRLRRDGAFVAVPLFRVNTAPIGPHPVGLSLRVLIALPYPEFFEKVRMRFGRPPKRSLLCFRTSACIGAISGNSSSFLSTFGLFFLNTSLCTNSVLVHPLTREEVSRLSSFTWSNQV